MAINHHHREGAGSYTPPVTKETNTKWGIYSKRACYTGI